MKRHGSRRFTRCLTLFVCAATLPFAVFAQSVCLIEGGAPTCGEAPDVGSSNKRVERGQHVGNPVDLTTGNKYQRGDDYRALDSPLMFSRHYNSSLVDHDVGLGRGWRHSYDVVLTQASDGSYRIVQSDGRELRFAADASETSNDSTRHASIRDGDGVLDVAERSVWTTAEGRRLTFNGSYLVRIEDTAGRSLSLFYRQRRLAEVRDDDGQVLRLHYAPGSRSLGVYDDANRIPAGHLAWIELPDGSRLVYAYDKHLNLTAVTDPIGERIDYRYDDPDWPSHLTVVAANGARVGAWNYDESGRAIGWTVSGDRGLVTYLDDARNDEVGQTRVLFWNGRQKDFTWATDVDGSHHVTAINPLPDRLSRHEVVEIFAAVEGLPGFRKTPAETTAGAGELPVGASTQRTLSASPLDAVVNMTLPLSEGPLADASSIALSVIFDRLGRVHDIGHRGLWARELISRAERMPTRHRKLAESPLSTLSFSTLLERLQATTIPVLTTPESIETTIQTLIGAADAINRDNEQRSREESVRLREQIDPQGAVCPLPHRNDCDDVRDHRDMAELSACAYPRTSCSTRFIRVDPATLSMDDTDFMIGGFPVHLYLDPVRDRYVLAFRGTGALSDVDDDLLNGMGLSSEQYGEAVRLARDLEIAIERVSPDSDLTFTGHSLGGGLATVAALATERESTIFNAASVTPGTARWLGLDLVWRGEFVHNVHVGGDPVTAGQRAGGALGSIFGSESDVHQVPYPGDASIWNSTLPQPPEHWITAQNGGQLAGLIERPLILHGIAAVNHSLDYLIDTHCRP